MLRIWISTKVLGCVEMKLLNRIHPVLQCKVMALSAKITWPLSTGMGCLAQTVSPCFDALKLCFETQFICLQLEDVPIFIPDLNSFSVSNPIFLFVIVRKVACFYLLWVYSSCRWLKNERKLEMNWRASCLLQDSCAWVSTGSRPHCTAEIAGECETLVNSDVCWTLAL